MTGFATHPQKHALEVFLKFLLHIPRQIFTPPREVRLESGIECLNELIEECQLAAVEQVPRCEQTALIRQSVPSITELLIYIE